eukprot:310796_1
MVYNMGAGIIFHYIIINGKKQLIRNRNRTLSQLLADSLRNRAELLAKEYDELHDQQVDIEAINKMENIEHKYEKTGRFNCSPSTISDTLLRMFYTILIVIGIIATILYLFVYENKDMIQFILLISVIVTTWIGVIIGIIAIYNGATIRSSITDLKLVNEQHAANLQEFQKQRLFKLKKIKDLCQESNRILYEEKKLAEHAKKFEAITHEFDALRKHYTSIDKIFENMRSAHNILKRFNVMNEKAKLLKLFYESNKDSSPGLSRTEFERFTAKVPYVYEKLLQELDLYEFDKWDTDSNGIVSYQEFQKIIVKLIEKVEYK